VHGLVQVAGAGRVDGHQRQVGRVVLGQRRIGRHPVGLGQHGGRELVGDPGLLPDRGEVERSGHLQHASHAVTLAQAATARGPPSEPRT
jgi:hypothetical protein